MISYNSLKIFFPPILWNLLSRYYRYFKNNKKKYDIRRWWSGEAISANGETFKNYQFLESDQKYITIYLEKEAKETILIKKKKSLKIKFQFKNKIQPYKVLFTFGNINDQVIEGKIDIKSDDITIISLKNLRPKAWNRVRSFFKNEEILEIINCTNRDIYFTAPTVIYKYENKKDLTKDIIFIALDQVDLALRRKKPFAKYIKFFF